NAQAAASEIRNFSAKDAERYGPFREFLGRIQGFFQRLLDRPAPDLASLGLGHLFEVAGSALPLRRLAERAMPEVQRIGPLGVVLESGAEIAAPVVVSSCDPKRTFRRFLSPRDVPPSLPSAMQHWRCRGTTAKVHLALSGSLEFAGRPGARIEWARTGEEMDD